MDVAGIYQRTEGKMTLGNFTNTFLQQLDNPQCSMLAGGLMGEIFIVRWVFSFIAIYFIANILIKFIDNFAVNPFIEWLKLKIKNAKDKKTEKR